MFVYDIIIEELTLLNIPLGKNSVPLQIRDDLYLVAEKGLRVTRYAELKGGKSIQKT